jgi:hypothetical protein
VAILEFEVGLDGIILVIEVGEARHEVLYDVHGARTGWREKREGEKAGCWCILRVRPMRQRHAMF